MAKENGCGCNVQNWLDVAQEIEQEVRVSGQFTNEASVKQEVAKRFTLQHYVPDVRSMQPELQGDEVIPGEIAYNVTKDGLTYIDDAGRVHRIRETFIDKRQIKGLEDRQESETLLLAERKVLSSPYAEVWFPVHNSEFGDRKIRFLGHWKRQGDKVITEMVRIAPDEAGKPLSETQQIARELLRQQFNEYKSESGVFIFSNVSDSAEVVKKRSTTNLTPDIELQRPQLIDSSFRSNNTITGITKDFEAIGRRVATDVMTGTVTVGSLAFDVLRKKIKKEYQEVQEKGIPSLRKRLLRNSRIERNKEKHLGVLEAARKRNSTTIFENGEITRKPKERGKNILATLKAKRKEVASLKTAIAFAAESGVGVGAGLLALRLMSREFPRSLRKINRERLSPRKNLRYKETKRPERKRRKEMKRKGTKLGKEKKITVKPERKKPEEKLRKRVKEVRGAFVEKRWFRTERKPVSAKRRENQLRRAATFLARRFERVRRQASERAKKKRKDILRVSEQIDPKTTFLSSHEKQRKKEAVIGFSFAWVLWLLLSTHREKRIREARITKQTENSKQEPLPIKESTQWILLSIIWYLVMIREQGMKQQTHVKRTKKKKSVMQQFRYPTMPARGVIFALGS